MEIIKSTKALFVGISGTALQWYDFAIFGYFAPIIAKEFFPSKNHIAALLSTFTIFAVGHLLSPLGAVLFGYIGDHYGRKKALSISILVMAISTAMIGLVPSYAYLGIAAPILITLFRLIQGFVASSEFTGSAIYLVEHAKPKQKAFFGCLTSSAYSTGTLVAGVGATFFTASFMPSWGWRLGFIIAFIIGGIIFYLRKHIEETPVYQSIDANKLRTPFLTAIKEMPMAVIGVIALAWLVSIMTFGTYVFTASYLHSYSDISLSLATLIITISLLVDAALEPLIALIADRVGLIKISTLGMVLLIALAVPLFHLLASGNIHYIVVAMVTMSIVLAITYAPLNAYMISLFPPQYRFSGFGVSFNLGVALFGGTTPLFMMWLINATGNLIAPAWYFIFGACVGGVGLFLCEKSKRKFRLTDKLVLNQREGVA